MSDLLVAPLLMKDELSSAIIMLGALSVMTFGAYLMLMLYVDNLDTLTRVNNLAIATYYLYSCYRRKLNTAQSLTTNTSRVCITNDTH
jgi:hypothetical protein